MTIGRRGVGIAIVLIAGFRGAAAAQSYGLGDQVLTVGASAFRGRSGRIDGLDGYLYATSTNDSIFVAPVMLPDGAEITQICFYARNEDPSISIELGLQAVKLAPGGLAPGIVSIAGAAVAADFHFGYGVVCTDPLSYTIHDTADVDNDQVPEHVAHRLRLLFNNSASPVVAAGGARITWHRQISPPPVTASFSDVPTGHIFFQYIEALNASGITGGCGNGKYCPDNPLTRGQMAVFLAKALGLHWPL